MYFKVLQLDTTGVAKQCICRVPYQEPLSNYRPASYIITQEISNPKPALTFPNNIPIGNSNIPHHKYSKPQQSQFESKAPNYRCFGCFDPSHMLGECPKMAELVRSGIVQYDSNTRKFYMHNGQPLYRRCTESLIDTIQHMQKPMPQMNFVTVGNKEVTQFYDELSSSNNSDSEIDSEYENNIIEWNYANYTSTPYNPDYGTVNVDSKSDTEEVPFVYPAERTAKKSMQARKDISKVPSKTKFDGVWPPPLRRTRSGGNSAPEPTSKPISKPLPLANPIPSSFKDLSVPNSY
jgi:hypothetical protein